MLWYLGTKNPANKTRVTVNKITEILILVLIGYFVNAKVINETTKPGIKQVIPKVEK